MQQTFRSNLRTDCQRNACRDSILKVSLRSQGKLKFDSVCSSATVTVVNSNPNKCHWATSCFSPPFSEVGSLFLLELDTKVKDWNAFFSLLTGVRERLSRRTNSKVKAMVEQLDRKLNSWKHTVQCEPASNCGALFVFFVTQWWKLTVPDWLLDALKTFQHQKFQFSPQCLFSAYFVTASSNGANTAPEVPLRHDDKWHTCLLLILMINMTRQTGKALFSLLLFACEFCGCVWETEQNLTCSEVACVRERDGERGYKPWDWVSEIQGPTDLFYREM